MSTIGVGVHLRELRQRLLVCVGALALFWALAYVWVEPITDLFMAPLFRAAPQIHALVYTHLTEAFIAYIKLAFLVALAAVLPVVLFQAWRYVAPALYPHERRIAGVAVLVGSGLFFLGMVFALAAVLPRMLTFFMAWAHDLRPLPRLGAYLTFVARLAMGFGLAFELPFLVVILVRTGLLPRAYLVKRRLYAYGSLAGLALLLAGGDLLATAMLLAPLVLLYEAGVFASRFFAPRLPTT